ncbi:hypothetical protein [Demequina activiva]|uniref:Uncharacterized protein n=1 Tax=Demequina activiva TaxID=1582364 RepID=A0A919Q2P8_9MICO|nr:hypothetical protein [Demequina activiva]GIG54766.1 hypothetical protein Dac01nite_15180 [Demequina activiva]
MTYLSRAAVASAADIGFRPVMNRWGKVRAVTRQDAAAIGAAEDARALVTLRAGITERASGGVAGAAVALGVVASLAVVGLALWPPAETIWGWLVALVLLILGGTVVLLMSFDAEPRSDAWCYLLDRRIRQLDGPPRAGATGPATSLLSRLTGRAPRT